MISQFILVFRVSIQVLHSGYKSFKFYSLSRLDFLYLLKLGCVINGLQILQKEIHVVHPNSFRLILRNAIMQQKYGEIGGHIRYQDIT
jgi:hypothetical protein